MADYIGFNGTVDEVGWSQLASNLGAEYSFEQIDAANTLTPTISTTVARAVNVSGGVVYNHGVRAVFAGGAIALDTVGSGDRWDTISLRFNWSTNTATLVKSNGGATPGAVATRGPGGVDDYIICLARVTAGQTAVQELIERRIASMPPVWWLSTQPPNPANYRYGQELLRLDTHERMVRRGGPGTETWDSLTHPTPTSLTLASGITSTDAPSIRHVGGQTFIEGQVTRSAGFAAGAYTTVATLPSSPAYFRPAKNKGYSVSTGANTGDSTAKVLINAASGLVQVYPSVSVTSIDLNGINWFG